MEDASLVENRVNTSGTGSKTDTPLTQANLALFARHLARLRPTVAPAARPLVSNLIGQLGNYERNPKGLRPMIMATIDRLAAVNAEDQ